MQQATGANLKQAAIADRLGQSRTGRWVAIVALAVSVFSVSYQLWNPWRHPWLFDLMLELGWSGY